MCNITVQIGHLEICIHSSINEYMVIFELFRIYFQKGWVITSCYDVVDTLFDDAPLLTLQICTIVDQQHVRINDMKTRSHKHTHIHTHTHMYWWSFDINRNKTMFQSSHDVWLEES